MDKEAQFTIGMKYGQGPAVSKAGIDRLSKDIVDHQEDRKKLSRRRMTAERFDSPHMSSMFENFITLNILFSFLETSDHSSLTHEPTTLIITAMMLISLMTRTKPLTRKSNAHSTSILSRFDKILKEVLPYDNNLGQVSELTGRSAQCWSRRSFSMVTIMHALHYI